MKQAHHNTKQVSCVSRHWCWFGLCGLVAAALLPVVGHQLRTGQIRCDMDGQEINPLFRVSTIERDGSRHMFCCLSCTELWLKKSGGVPRQVLVTDEASGQWLNAGDAHYVRSSISSNAPTRDQRHVFSLREVADSHARSFHGRVLTGSDRPFNNLPSPSSAARASNPSPSDNLISS